MGVLVMAKSKSYMSAYRAKKKQKNTNKLPNGAVAFTVKFKGTNRSEVYKQGNGFILSAPSLDSRFSPVPGKINTTDINVLYERAISKGMQVTLHSKEEYDEAQNRLRQRKAENNADIAYSEMHPNAGKAGVHSRRILTRKSDFRRSIY